MPGIVLWSFARVLAFNYSISYANYGEILRILGGVQRGPGDGYGKLLFAIDFSSGCSSSQGAAKALPRRAETGMSARARIKKDVLKYLYGMYPLTACSSEIWKRIRQ
jgi:hypothetical protein